jgi:apolipoprotein N-acyltransferase
MDLIFISIISAIFWSLPYLTSLFLPTIFISLIPVLYFVYSGKVKTIKYFVLIALVASVISLFGVRDYNLKAYVFSITVTVLFAVAFLFLSKKLIYSVGRGSLSIFIPAAVWTTLCLTLNIRSLFTGAFDVGIALPFSAPLIWYIGSIGITYLVITWSSSLARFFALRDKSSLVVLVFITAVLLTSVSYSLTKSEDTLIGNSKPVKVSLVQNNITESWQWLQQNPYKALKADQKLTKKAAEQNPDIIVWPEYALPVDIVNSHSTIRGAVSEIAQKSNAKLVIGSILFDKETDWHDDIALIINKEGKIEDKRSSVEPAPFNRYTNRSKAPLKPVDNFGTIICWEELNPDISRGYVNNGAEFLVSLTNNQDFDNSYLKYYVPFYSRARAAENMRYFARVANTGVTQIIDPFGRVVNILKPDTPSVLTSYVYPITKKTFYTRKGPMIVIIANILVGLCLVIGSLKNRLSVSGEKRWFV